MNQAHLLRENSPWRYAFHDLLRAYSTEQTHQNDDSSDNGAALHRVLDHYRRTTVAASLLVRFRNPIALGPLQPWVTPEELSDRQQALAWFQTERHMLLAAARQAAENGLNLHAWQLPWAMATLLDQLGYWHDLVATQRSALSADTQLDDPSGQAQAHRHLARGQMRTPCTRLTWKMLGANGTRAGVRGQPKLDAAQPAALQLFG
jgi:hypothetical protein